MNLTKREKQVVREIALGGNYKQIAFTLGLAFNSVKVYASRLRWKTKIDSRAVFVALALREGIVTLDEIYALLPKGDG